MLQAGRFKGAKEFPEASILVEEPLNFRVKINLKTARDSYEAWHEGIHDDLVLSVAWLAGQQSNILLPCRKKGIPARCPGV